MDRQVFARLAPLLLIAPVLSGCAAGAQVGQVVVEVRAMAPDAQSDAYDVSVLGGDGEPVGSREVRVGSATTFENVPLGWVTVEAASSCTGESELTSQHPTLRLVIDAEHCSVTD